VNALDYNATLVVLSRNNADRLVGVFEPNLAWHTGQWRIIEIQNVMLIQDLSLPIMFDVNSQVKLKLHDVSC